MPTLIMAYSCVHGKQKRKAELVKTGGPPSTTLSQAKELAIANNTGRAIIEGGQESSIQLNVTLNLNVQGNIIPIVLIVK